MNTQPIPTSDWWSLLLCPQCEAWRPLAGAQLIWTQPILTYARITICLWNGKSLTYARIIICLWNGKSSLQWHHNERDSVSNQQPHDCLLNGLFRRRSKKASKPGVTGLCVGNSPVTGESPHKGTVTRKMFPFDDVIMFKSQWNINLWYRFLIAQWQRLTQSVKLCDL